MPFNTRLYPNKVTVGLGVKRTGRVEPTQAIKSPIYKTSSEGGPSLMETNISKANVVKDGINKVASQRPTCEKGVTAPAEFEKEAGIIDEAGKSLGLGAAMSIGGIAAAGLANAALGGISSIVDKPKYRATLQKAIQINPKLQDPRITHEQLEAYLDLVVEASPSVAKNPLLLSNYLQYLIEYGGAMNFEGYRKLVDLEGQILRNKDSAKPLTNTAQKALLEGTMRRTLGVR